MKVLLDHNIPLQLISRLDGHDAFSARQMEWDRLKNGDLLAAAQRHGSIRSLPAIRTYQQNNNKRILAIMLLSAIKRCLILADTDIIRRAIERSIPGGFELVSIRSILGPIPIE